MLGVNIAKEMCFAIHMYHYSLCKGGHISLQVLRRFPCVSSLKTVCVEVTPGSLSLVRRAVGRSP